MPPWQNGPGRRHTAMRDALVVTVIALGCLTFGPSRPSRDGVVQAPESLKATRFVQNPLITLRSSSSLGDNIDGPTVIRVPPWVDHPLGRYYMYFAHHM